MGIEDEMRKEEMGLTEERMDEIGNLIDQHKESEIDPEELKRWHEQTDKEIAKLKERLKRITG